jgi:hypothetical protein
VPPPLLVGPAGAAALLGTNRQCTTDMKDAAAAAIAVAAATAGGDVAPAVAVATVAGVAAVAG